MLAFPNCKINLGLHITAKRSDGFHNLETVFYPILLKDVLEVVQADELQFTATGLAISGPAESNLCLKAYHLLKQDFSQLPPVHIHLLKVIPMGAGLGGGSSDGAFMLTLLNNKFNLQIPVEQLLRYALQLGSDCPFFIINQPCLASGRGEILTPIEVDLSGYKILVVNPAIHISTKEAFAELKPQQPKKALREIILQPMNTWKDELNNDFEVGAFLLHPAIKNIKKQLYGAGATYASMTGTGSTVFGIFKKEDDPELTVFADYFHQWV